MKKNPVLKMGIAGTGEYTGESIQVLKKLKRFQVSGIYCEEPETGHHLSEQYKLNLFSTRDEMLDEVEGVVWISDEKENPGLFAEIIKKGKHLFIVTTSMHLVPVSPYLLDLQEEAGVVVQAHLKERYYAPVSSVLPYIHFPLFIESVQNLPSLNGTEIEGRLFERIQLLLSLMKANVRKSWGDGISIPLRDRRLLSLKMQFDSACVANMIAGSIAKEDSDTIRFVHKDMIVSLDLLSRHLEIQSFVNPKELDLPATGESAFQFRKSGKEEVWIATQDFQYEPPALIFERELKAFYLSIVEGEEVKIDLHNMLETTRIVQSMTIK